MSVAAKCCHLYCLLFSDGQAYWAKVLKDAIIPVILSAISSFVTAYITAHGVPKCKAHVCCSNLME